MILALLLLIIKAASTKYNGGYLCSLKSAEMCPTKPQILYLVLFKIETMSDLLCNFTT